MATRTKSLLALRTLARRYADVEASQHVTDDELTEYINDSLASLHAMIVERDEDEYAIEQTAAVPSGSTSVNLTNSAYKILNVQILLSNGEWRTLDRFLLSERPMLDSMLAGNQYAPAYYRMRGAGTVELAPPASSDTTLKVVYVAPFTDLASDSEKFDGRNGWDRWVAWDAAIKIMVKEETDSRQAVSERDRAWNQIAAQLGNRDRANPDVVTDVTGRRDADLRRRYV